VANERIVWIVSSQHWPRACLRAELIERGYDAVGFLTLARALAALRRPYRALPCVIVLELCGLALQRDELEDTGRFGVPIVVLGGAVELNTPLVSEFDWEAMVQRPFAIGQVVDVVEAILLDIQLET
jgi:hypothetical protein